MNESNHERARKLLAKVAVEGILAGERDWLDRHLESCVECSTEARALSAAVQSFRAIPIAVSSDLARQTKMAVRMRAQQLQAARARSTPLWIATAISSVCMIVTTPYVWQAFAWLGRVASVPNGVWEVGFLMWWFLPATVLAAAAAFRHTTERNWGQI
jgi:anti-sigma factor RsiW